MKIQVFDYITELDCFVVREELKQLVDRLGISEWTPVVWLGRLVTLDQDYGEHIFDNWDERDQLEEKARKLGLDTHELMIVVPDRFKAHSPFCLKCNERLGQKAICPKCESAINVGPDGPCHSDAVRKRFWTDVFDSLKVDLETLFAMAREYAVTEEEFTKGVVEKVERTIKAIKGEYSPKKT